MGPAVAGVATTGAAKAVATSWGGAPDYYIHRCLGVGLGQLQCGSREGAAKWAQGEARHMGAGYIWGCSRGARLGGEGGVWQQQRWGAAAFVLNALLQRITRKLRRVGYIRYTFAKVSVLIGTLIIGNELKSIFELVVLFASRAAGRRRVREENTKSK